MTNFLIKVIIKTYRPKFIFQLLKILSDKQRKKEITFVLICL